ncbi:MAG TPA: HIT family protein [Candidatus Methylomirabilis sp.]|nr:HIT family protein [Candidatus Methylomirabilis sp.]
MTACPLCHPGNETVLWHDARCRVILADDPDYAGFCRVIWQEHVKEMTDLAEADREHLMSIVFTVERTLRDLLHPDKINLALLGNRVPHLHWHVIPRFIDDAHFPDAIWATRRCAAKADASDRAALSGRLSQLLRERLD